MTDDVLLEQWNQCRAVGGCVEDQQQDRDV